jgi:hypothetical protein
MKKYLLFPFLLLLITGAAFSQKSLSNQRPEIPARDINFLKKSNDLHIPSPSKEKSQDYVVYFEGFESSPNPNNGALPEGWTIKRTNNLSSDPVNDAEEPKWFRHEPGVYGFSAGASSYVYSGNASMAIAYTAPGFTWAISPEFTITSGLGDVAYLTFYKWYVNDGDAGFFPTNLHVKIFADGQWTLLNSWIGSQLGAEGNNSFDQMVGLELSAYIGKSVQLAFVYEYTDGYQMAIDHISVAILPERDNGISSVNYRWYRWWPPTSGNTLLFEVNVDGLGLEAYEGEVSMYVNNKFVEKQNIEALVFGMSTYIDFYYTPWGRGQYNVRFELSSDDNPGNNIAEVGFYVQPNVAFSSGFENVEWDADPPQVIFPPQGWLITDGWDYTINSALDDIISARVAQVNGDPEEFLITPPITLTPGNKVISFNTGGINNGITIEDEGYLGHSTLRVYLSDQIPGKSEQNDVLLHTESFENGDFKREIVLEAEIIQEAQYYLIFVTSSTFNYEDFESHVIIDNVLIYDDVRYNVIFNIDMTGVVGFDPDVNNVFLTGSFAGWAEPGSEGSYEMVKAVEKNEDRIIFTVVVEDVSASTIYYNYYSDAFGSGFDGNDFDTDVIRSIGIFREDVIVNDVWGIDFTSVPETLVNEDPLLVYPNPARNVLNIINSTLIENVKVFDITGRMILSKRMDDLRGQIDISGFYNGLYILQIESDGRFTNKKFTVKN